MKTLKLKDKATDGPGLPTVSLQHPSAHLGTVTAPHFRAVVTTIEITDIPDDVPAAEVVRLWRYTCNLTWLMATPRYTFRFGELGVGAIIR